MNIRSLFSSPDHRASLIKARALLVTVLVSTLALTLAACTHNLYQFPEYNFAGRPVPPSSLAERVMVAISFTGTSGGLQILDGMRDIRNNIENTKPIFSISGYSGGFPSMIYNFPEQQRGYVYSSAAPYSLGTINYSTESSLGAAGSLSGASSGFGISSDFLRIYAAEEAAGQLVVVDDATGAQYALTLPNVFNVVTNQADTVTLAMVRNSNTLYRVIKLPVGSVNPPGAADCEPLILPIYCVVPVPGTYDRPVNVSYSLDGATAYVLNCGVECGGGGNGGAGVSFLPEGALNINTIPTSFPYANVVTNTIPIPGGVTAALSNGTTLYLSGQQLQPDGLFEGKLTLLNLATLTPSAPITISDGNHSKMLFADDNTLWIGSQNCATGEHAKLGLNYNCLTRFDLGSQATSIVPAILPATSTAPASVPYPNANYNLLYYGSLTGICWVQNFHKVYTAYGGQVHAFNTLDGSEINNSQITVQGTALDVAYMDALTNTAN